MNYLSINNYTLNSKNQELSEGEEFVLDFLRKTGIKFEKQKQIDGLKGDSKQYRIADFYLPDFNIYLEFLGMWNNKNNDEYKRKMDVYRYNNIPCVYLYPDNLGIIQYVLDKRIQKVMHSHGLKRQLVRYRLFKLRQSNKFQISLAILISTVFLITLKDITLLHKTSGDYILFSIIALIGVLQLPRLFNVYRLIFHKNKFTLDMLDE